MATTLVSQLEPPQYLMPAKFLLVMGQILLLTLVLYLRTNYLFWDNFSGEKSWVEMTHTESLASENQLVGVTVCFIIFMAFEFLMMILGVSLMYN